MPTALFFDFDGLVCDTERAAKQSWELTYQVLGHTFPEHVWTRMTGRSNGHSYALDDLAGRLGRPVSEAEISLRLSHKQQLADEQPLRPGVIELLDDQEVRRVMGKEARERCRPFSMEAVAPRYLTLYRELLGEAGAS